MLEDFELIPICSFQPSKSVCKVGAGTCALTRDLGSFERPAQVAAYLLEKYTLILLPSGIFRKDEIKIK